MNRVIGVSAKEVHRQGVALAELGGEKHGGDGKELQLLPRDSTLGQKPVHVAHSQGKHLLLTLLLLAYLEETLS